MDGQDHCAIWRELREIMRWEGSREWAESGRSDDHIGWGAGRAGEPGTAKFRLEHGQNVYLHENKLDVKCISHVVLSSTFFRNRLLIKNYKIQMWTEGNWVSLLQYEMNYWKWNKDDIRMRQKFWLFLIKIYCKKTNIPICRYLVISFSFFAFLLSVSLLFLWLHTWLYCPKNSIPPNHLTQGGDKES